MFPLKAVGFKTTCNYFLQSTLANCFTCRGLFKSFQNSRNKNFILRSSRCNSKKLLFSFSKKINNKQRQVFFSLFLLQIFWTRHLSYLSKSILNFSRHLAFVQNFCIKFIISSQMINWAFCNRMMFCLALLSSWLWCRSLVRFLYGNVIRTV